MAGLRSSSLKRFGLISTFSFSFVSLFIGQTQCPLMTENMQFSVNVVAHPLNEKWDFEDGQLQQKIIWPNIWKQPVEFLPSRVIARCRPPESGEDTFFALAPKQRTTGSTMIIPMGTDFKDVPFYGHKIDVVAGDENIMFTKFVPAFALSSDCSSGVVVAARTQELSIGRFDFDPEDPKDVQIEWTTTKNLAELHNAVINVFISRSTDDRFYIVLKEKEMFRVLRYSNLFGGAQDLAISELRYTSFGSFYMGFNTDVIYFCHVNERSKHEGSLILELTFVDDKPKINAKIMMGGLTVPVGIEVENDVYTLVFADGTNLVSATIQVSDDEEIHYNHPDNSSVTKIVTGFASILNNPSYGFEAVVAMPVNQGRTLLQMMASPGELYVFHPKEADHLWYNPFAQLVYSLHPWSNRVFADPEGMTLEIAGGFAWNQGSTVERSITTPIKKIYENGETEDYIPNGPAISTATDVMYYQDIQLLCYTNPISKIVGCGRVRSKEIDMFHLFYRDCHPFTISHWGTSVFVGLMCPETNKFQTKIKEYLITKDADNDNRVDLAFVKEWTYPSRVMNQRLGFNKLLALPLSDFSDTNSPRFFLTYSFPPGPQALRYLNFSVDGVVAAEVVIPMCPKGYSISLPSIRDEGTLRTGETVLLQYCPRGGIMVMIFKKPEESHKDIWVTDRKVIRIPPARPGAYVAHSHIENLGNYNPPGKSEGFPEITYPIEDKEDLAKTIAATVLAGISVFGGLAFLWMFAFRRTDDRLLAEYNSVSEGAGTRHEG